MSNVLSFKRKGADAMTTKDLDQIKKHFQYLKDAGFRGSRDDVMKTLDKAYLLADDFNVIGEYLENREVEYEDTLYIACMLLAVSSRPDTEGYPEFIQAIALIMKSIQEQI